VSTSTPPRLRRGDLLPRIEPPVPGPLSRQLSRRLRRAEAPGINTLPAGTDALVWSEARGSNVVDVDGNRFVDLSSGFGAAAIGHRHPAVVAALRQQSSRLVHGLGDVAAHPGRIALAERLGRRAPFDEPQVYFAVSGADAIEIALKTAQLVTGRPGMVGFDGGYHGLTLGALAVGGLDAFRRPFAPRLDPHARRLPYGAPVAVIDAALAETRPACVVVEPIQGRGGIVLPPAGWLPELAHTCRHHGVLLVVDEILTGGGRTGRFFAIEEDELTPDLICCGKAIGGGLPLAAVIGPRSLMSHWPGGGEALHTATFVAHPLACAAAHATLDLIAADDLAGRAARLGREVAARLAGWPARHPSVVAVRGRGLLWGIELDSAERGAEAMAAARDRGLLLLAGAGGRVLELAPALTVAPRQLDWALSALEGLLGQLADGPRTTG